MSLTDIAVSMLDQNKILLDIEDTAISTYMVVDDIGKHLKKAEERRLSQSGDQLESSRDSRIRDNQVLRTLQNIETALREGRGNSGGESSSGGGTTIIGGLGLIPKLLAGSVGIVLGLVIGQIDAIKAFMPKKFDEIKTSISTTLRNAKVGLQMNIELIKSSINEKIASVRTAMSNGLTRISDFFKISDDSKLGKALTSIKTGLSGFAKPFITAGEVISEFVSGASGKAVDTVSDVFGKMKAFFTGIGSKLGSIGTIIGGVAKTVGKLFAPLAIVMTIFDTIKGAISGFAEGGILGGLKGAIEGFFNSLIFGPLDMIKDAIAWVLGFFGFENAEKILKDFSFAETFTKIIDALFYPFEWISEKVGGFIDSIPKAFTGFIDSILPEEGYLRDKANSWFGLGQENESPPVPEPSKGAEESSFFDTIWQNQAALMAAIPNQGKTLTEQTNAAAQNANKAPTVIMNAPSQSTTNVSNGTLAVGGGLSVTDPFDFGTRR